MIDIYSGFNIRLCGIKKMIVWVEIRFVIYNMLMRKFFIKDCLVDKS